MFKRLPAIFGALLLLPSLLFAQPQPCEKPEKMTPFCHEACIICDINGFKGRNDNPIKGVAPPGFCTNTQHHIQWIGFIAGSKKLVLNVRPSNCENGGGLEVGVYYSIDCQNFTLVSNCNGDIPPNTNGVFTMNNLVVGQYYYFVMDGNQDDVCDYTITVVEGTTEVAKIPASGPITGDLTVCPGRSETYTVDPYPGAAWFEWTLDGVPLGEGIDTTVQVNWTAVGDHQLCVTASNVCDTAPPSCQMVSVRAIPTTLVRAQICDGACWEGADTTICDPGLYQFHFSGQEACDSLVLVEIEKLPAAATALDLLICDGDSVFVAGKPFFKTGIFTEKMPSANGCDSTITLDLQVIICEIEGSLVAEPIACNGQPTGALQFYIADGTPPFQYSWERIGTGSPSGTGNVGGLNVPLRHENLPVGTYFITVTDNFGNDAVLFADVTEPPPLAGQLVASDFNGVNVRCAGGSDGQIELLPSGGKNPYTVVWDDGSTDFWKKNLPAGTYSCTITDANFCTETLSATLVEPPPLSFDAAFDDPGCAGLDSGRGEVVAVGGGIGGFRFSLDGGVFDTATVFQKLFPGRHTLTVRDANGCEIAVADSLSTPYLPDIALGADPTIELGESIRLQLSQNVPIDVYAWSPPLGLSCTDCPEPDATPIKSTTYVLDVTAPGGCVDVDSVTVTVVLKYDVYIPNTFSPGDENGLNDFFTVFGGPEVSNVRYLEVWSRWGELVFRKENFQPNVEPDGWDGKFRGKLMLPGVYTWMAEVEFVDATVQVFQGNLTLVR